MTRLRPARWSSAPSWLRLWARDSITFAGSQFAATVVITALAVIVARYLGPSQFGIFAGFLGLSQVLMLFSGLGVPTWLLRELSRTVGAGKTAHSEEESRYLAGAIVLSATLMAVFTVGSVVVGQIIGSSIELTVALGALMLYMGLLSCAAVLEVVFRAHRRLSKVVAATMLEKISLTAIVIVAVSLDVGIAGIAAAYIAAGVLRVVWDLHAMRAADFITFSRPDLGDMRHVVLSAIPFGLGSAVPTAIVRLDLVLIALLSTSAAGLYAVGDRFMGVLVVIPAACASAIYPHLARQPNPVAATWRAAALIGALGAALAGIGIFLVPHIVPLLLGPSFEEAVPAVQIMLFAAPLVFACSILMAGMFSGGHERRALVVMMGCSVSGTIFVIAGTAWFGVEGAAAGYVCRFVVFLVALAALSTVLRSRATVVSSRQVEEEDVRVVPTPQMPL